jgi:predicted dehydrogenase
MRNDSKVRLGFIGAGWWATANHAEVLRGRDDVLFTAVCARTSKTLARAQQQFGFAFATTDYRELLAQPLDAVVVSTPHVLHYPHAKAALEAGYHVMVEKPMTLRAAEAWDLVETAREANLHLLVPYGWHYKPMVMRAKDLMDGGAVGRVEYVVCHMASAMREMYAGCIDPEGFGDAPAPGAGTYSDPELTGGGQGQSQLSHAIALALWLTGLRASAVFALMSSPGAQVDLYDAMSVRFEGGAIGTISGAGTMPTAQPRQQLDVRIFGSDGVLYLDLGREWLETIRNDGECLKVPVKPGDGHYSCDGPPNRFVDLILGHETANQSPGEVAARATGILDAAYRSAASGRPESA